MPGRESKQHSNQTIAAGSDGTGMRQLDTTVEDIPTLSTGTQNSENTRIIEENYDIINRVPKDMVTGGIQLREFLKSGKMFCIPSQQTSDQLSLYTSRHLVHLIRSHNTSSYLVHHRPSTRQVHLL